MNSHVEPHFHANGLCQCPCSDCTSRPAWFCTCLDCPCDGPEDHHSADGGPGDPLAALGDGIALGYGGGISAAVRGAFKEEAPAAAVEWPAGIPDGPWETVSVHTLELPAGWPPGCRCVLSDGVRVPLGGPCPVEHS